MIIEKVSDGGEGQLVEMIQTESKYYTAPGSTKPLPYSNHVKPRLLSRDNVDNSFDTEGEWRQKEQQQ